MACQPCLLPSAAKAGAEERRLPGIFPVSHSCAQLPVPSTLFRVTNQMEFCHPILGSARTLPISTTSICPTRPYRLSSLSGLQQCPKNVIVPINDGASTIFVHRPFLQRNRVRAVPAFVNSARRPKCMQRLVCVTHRWIGPPDSDVTPSLSVGRFQIPTTDDAL